MALSRKNYVAIAAALKASQASIETVKAVAEVFEQDNPRFDRDRFLSAACGGE